MQVHEISVQQLLEQLQADPDKGLSGAEAARRLSHYPQPASGRKEEEPLAAFRRTV